MNVREILASCVDREVYSKRSVSDPLIATRKATAMMSVTTVVDLRVEVSIPCPLGHVLKKLVFTAYETQVHRRSS